MIDGKIVLCIGLRGYGKTTKVRELVLPSRRLIVADPEGKWEPQTPEDRVVTGHEALLSALRDAGATDPANPFRIVYRDIAPVMRVAAPAAAFAYRHLTLAWDELAWACTAHNLPEQMLRLIQMGRERAVNIIGTTREPAEIHNMIRSQAELVYFFRVQPGTGLTWVRRFYPVQAEGVENLPRSAFHTFGDVESVVQFGKEGLDFVRAAPHSSPRKKRKRRQASKG